MNTIQRFFDENVLPTRLGFHAYMAARWGSGKRAIPDAPWMNSALRTREQVERSTTEARRLRLPPCHDREKTWDTLAALREVLLHTKPTGRVLDAGAEMYSRMLPWLYLYGYRELVGNNLVFQETVRRGPLVYQPGDLTRSGFAASSFDAVTCLSVIEHGVDLEAYFAEMARILKPGGVLVTSTDYFETPTDTRGLSAYGVPIRVFTRTDLEGAFRVAERCGLQPKSPVDFSCGERIVRWAE